MAANHKVSSNTAAVLAMGWGFGWRIAAGFLIGYYLDLWLGTSPALTLVFALAAMVAGVMRLLTLLRAMQEERRRGDNP